MMKKYMIVLKQIRIVTAKIFNKLKGESPSFFLFFLLFSEKTGDISIRICYNKDRIKKGDVINDFKTKTRSTQSVDRCI